MDHVHIGDVEVSRFILGSNPFSGFSHLGVARDQEMRRYYTTARIKATIRAAESLGVNTLLARTDFHVMRMLLEYRDEGSPIQWFAQTCPEVGDHYACINRASDYGAKACHIHGGVMDNLLANDKLDEIPPAIDAIHRRGMLAGIAGHNVRVFEWAEKHLDVDYYMACYYNPIPRDRRAEHVSGTEEQYLEADRRAMIDLIQSLSKPAIHYKIMAAGRNDPAEALAVAARALRPNDAICVGVFTQDAPAMIQEDIELLEKSLAILHVA